MNVVENLVVNAAVTAAASGATVDVLDYSRPDNPVCNALSEITSTSENEFPISYSKSSDFRKLIDSLEKLRPNHTNERKRLIMIVGLQNIQLLESDDSYSPEPTVTERFAKILENGPSLGIHFWIWCDSVNSLEKRLKRNLWNQFNWKIFGQMSESASTYILDGSGGVQDLKPNQVIIRDESRGEQNLCLVYDKAPTTWYLDLIGLNSSDKGE